MKNCFKTNDSQQNMWFDVCKTSEIGVIDILQDKYLQSVDKRPFKILSINDQHEQPDVTIPGVTALFYAAYYGHKELFTKLLKHEIGCKTKQDLYLPTNEYVKPFQQYIRDLSVQVMFDRHQIQSYSFIPSDSTILQFCAYIHRIDFIELIFEGSTDFSHILNHKNSGAQNLLFLLLKYDKSFSKMAKYVTLFNGQVKYENHLGENVANLAVKCSPKKLSFVLAITDPINYDFAVKKLKELVDVQILEKQMIIRDFIQKCQMKDFSDETRKRALHDQVYLNKDNLAQFGTEESLSFLNKIYDISQNSSFQTEIEEYKQQPVQKEQTTKRLLSMASYVKKSSYRASESEQFQVQQTVLTHHRQNNEDSDLFCRQYNQILYIDS
uniref:Ankyrin repeat-containing protein n=1 Tax=Trepomonas sp. PC1 TaxID=1076344 RepID=A0A146KGD1_9EUKA|eukprot:JAP94695.1 hypothetical protein TPC1_12565 [Trepomonas sp. PC1]